MHIVKTLRRENRHVPVVFCGTLTDPTLRTRLVYVGGSAFVDKATLKTTDWPALIKQFTPSTDEPAWLRLADLALNRLTRTVYRAGQPIPLGVREYQLLECLLRHPNQVLTREQIFGMVWGPTTQPNLNMVTQYMGQVRQKMAGASDSALVHTVVGGGYLLVRLLG